MSEKDDNKKKDKIIQEKDTKPEDIKCPECGKPAKSYAGIIFCKNCDFV